MTLLTKRTIVLCMALAGCAAALPAQGAGWPERPVTIVVPFPAGGSNDVIARVFADRFTQILGQTFVVENKPGANGNIGAAQVARAAPDGYMLLLSGNGHNAMNHGLYSKMPYDSRKDFSHIALLASTANAIVVAPDFPAKTFKELIALAKQGGKAVSFGSPGVGSSGHMSMVMLQQAAGLTLQHVPYRGASPLLTDLLGGHVQLGILNVDIPLSAVKAGKLRVLAVSSAERSPLYPDAPAIAEEGFPGFAASGWMGLSGPPGTPAEIVAKLNDAVAKALQDSGLKQRLAEGGYASSSGTPDSYAAFVSSEIGKWSKVAKESGATLD
ncbi:MAG: tripartite tricarboxylate transporter substrate binding protein [Pseudolabrys sp.]|nr:tripartite tricarboxylate transporter substrate binding protein [Pseudolabrys sp.]